MPNNIVLSPVQSARNLGFLFDLNLINLSNCCSLDDIFNRHVIVNFIKKIGLRVYIVNFSSVSIIFIHLLFNYRPRGIELSISRLKFVVESI